MITILTIAVIVLVVERVIDYVMRFRFQKNDFATKLMEELDKVLEKAQQTSEG